MTCDRDSPRKLDTVLLKVASRCNLDCGYCYVYHMGDESWREQPSRMSPATLRRVTERLAEQLDTQGEPLSVVMHGGEPLMLGVSRLNEYFATLRAALPRSCGIHVQTNGVLLSEEIIDVLVRNEICVSISFDGPQAVHDRFRRDHRGLGSFAAVRAAISRIRGREDARALLVGVLAVIDPRSDPTEVYAALKETGVSGIDVLPRDGNWDQLPLGKLSHDTIEYGTWLEGLLACYLADPDPPRVRLLDDMLRLTLGGFSVKEGVGGADYGILVVEPDGNISKNDTLKVAKAGADRFVRRWSVYEDSFAEILRSPEFEEYYSQQRPTAEACASCPDLSVCGGGMVAHRWSEARGFANPSIYCADQRHLIRSMKRLTDALRNQAA